MKEVCKVAKNYVILGYIMIYSDINKIPLVGITYFSILK